MIQAKKKDPNFQAVFHRDLKKAIVFLKKDFSLPKYDYVSPKNVTFLLKIDDVLDKISELKDAGGYQAIDFETTGLKPQAEGHKVTSMAISTDAHSWSFPIDYREYWNDDEWEEIVDAVSEYLSEKNVKHIAHNKNFENVWGRHILESKKYVNYCTQATQHILDHRKGTKSLKYQIFKRWGLHSYEKTASRYISSDGGANSFNKMDEMPLPEQLLYVGIDAFCTMKLFKEQRKELQGKMKEADKLWQTSVNTMSYLQETGIRVDTKYYAKTEKELTNTIVGLEKSIHSNEEVIKFSKKFKKKFNETSPEDIKNLLFSQMGIESIKETENGGKAVDAEVLKKLDIPITNYILDLRKYLKLRDTYLAQYKREEVDGFLHPFFGLTVAVSYRSQSNNPNFQNVPKRDKESKKLVRRGIVPRKGNLLAEIDFSGMEVSTSATYHKDPNFIKYLVTPGTDMHRDNGSDIWQLPNEEITSEIRFFIKNGWTFPQFYGDYFGSCAPNLWETSLDLKIKSGITLKDHLWDLGIKSVDEFTEHCKTAEDILWNKRFKVYTAWKKRVNDFYLQNGYVETHLGFRFTGYMDKKQTANFPIQGTAFHLLLVCLNTLKERKEKYGWQSNIIGQVHDSGILDLVPEEAFEILSEFKHIAEVELAEMFPWINVPYKIDMELSEVDGSFAELTEHKLENGTFIKIED
jgi:DNA polymerase I-like protein with 3'-5' exonuclease and polymerase domains